MARYSDQITDQYGAPVVGASVYVYNRDETTAELEEDGGGALDNPVTSDEYGNFHFNAEDGLYILEYHFGGKTIFRHEAVPVGDPDDLYRGPAGPPGGNVQSIGLFADADGIDIDEGTERVCTAGWDTAGIGAAWYTYQPDFDLVTHPRAGFTAADDRIFALDRFNHAIDTFQFGVAGLVANDDEALDAFFRYCEAFIVYRAVLNGSCQVTETTRYGNGGDPATTAFYANRFVLQPADGATMDRLWHIQCKSIHIGGKMTIRGKASGDDYSDRQAVGVGIWLEDCREAVFDHLILQRFHYFGICSDPTNDSGNNNNGIEIKNLVGDGIGSGDSESADQSLFATWEHAATPHTGSGSDYGQRTHLIVPLNECPPLDIASSVNSTIDKLPLLIRLYGAGTNGDTNSSRGRLHQVTSITDNGDGTANVNIYPWMDPARGASGDLTWIFGALVKQFGDDGNYWKIGSLQYQRVGVALGISAQQGPVISRFVGQNQCGVGFIVGRTAISEDDSSGNGTWIQGAYFEDFFDQGINLSRFDDNRNSGRVASEFTLDLSKLHAISSPRSGTTGAIGAIDDETWHNWVFENNQTRLKHRPSPNTSPTEQGLDEYETITYVGNTVTIRLNNDTNIQKLFNRTRAIFVVKGTTAAANYAPTTVTFEVPSGGTLNGVVDGTYVLSGFAGPASFQVDTTATDVWRVAVMAGKLALVGSKTWDPGNLTPTSIEGTTLTITGASLGPPADGVIVSFSGMQAGLRLAGAVCAADTVQVYIQNHAAGDINPGSGTLTGRLIR